MAKFNPIALDQLLSDAVQSTNEIHNQLVTKQDEQDLVPAPAVSKEIDKMVNQNTGLTVDYSRVYAQLQKLIQNGNLALQVLGAVDPDVSGADVAGSTASLLNAIKNCIAEFTKIHLQHIKFQQVLQLEQIKHKHKLEQLQIKKQIQEAKAKNNNNTISSNNYVDIITEDNTNGEKKQTTMLPWQTQGINKYIQLLNKDKQ